MEVLEISFDLYQGNWRLYAGGLYDGKRGLGYYPGSLFSGGQMASNGDRDPLRWAETVTSAVSWPGTGQ